MHLPEILQNSREGSKSAAALAGPIAELAVSINQLGKLTGKVQGRVDKAIEVISDKIRQPR